MDRPVWKQCKRGIKNMSQKQKLDICSMMYATRTHQSPQRHEWRNMTVIKIEGVCRLEGQCRRSISLVRLSLKI